MITAAHVLGGVAGAAVMLLALYGLAELVGLVESLYFERHPRPLPRASGSLVPR